MFWAAFQGGVHRNFEELQAYKGTVKRRRIDSAIFNCEKCANNFSRLGAVVLRTPCEHKAILPICITEYYSLGERREPSQCMLEREEYKKLDVPFVLSMVAPQSTTKLEFRSRYLFENRLAMCEYLLSLSPLDRCCFAAMPTKAPVASYADVEQDISKESLKHFKLIDPVDMALSFIVMFEEAFYEIYKKRIPSRWRESILFFSSNTSTKVSLHMHQCTDLIWTDAERTAHSIRREMKSDCPIVVFDSIKQQEGFFNRVNDFIGRVYDQKDHKLFSYAKNLCFERKVTKNSSQRLAFALDPAGSREQWRLAGCRKSASKKPMDFDPTVTAKVNPAQVISITELNAFGMTFPALEPDVVKRLETLGLLVQPCEKSSSGATIDIAAIDIAVGPIHIQRLFKGYFRANLTANSCPLFESPNADSLPAFFAKCYADGVTTLSLRKRIEAEEKTILIVESKRFEILNDKKFHLWITSLFPTGILITTSTFYMNRNGDWFFVVRVIGKGGQLFEIRTDGRFYYKKNGERQKLNICL